MLASSATSSVKCPACASEGCANVRRVPDHEYAVARESTYASCPACRTSFQAPMPEERTLGSFYPANYHSMARDGVLTRIRYDMRVRRLSSVLDGEGAVLDYGCGDGSFLVSAARRMPGRKFFGYEIGDHPETRELAGGAVTLVRGPVSHLFDVLTPCRVITMNHVIEHLADPLDTLRKLREHLAPGGLLEGQTPAAASLEHRVFGTRWSGYHAPRHTVVFSRDGLRRFLERAGFADVQVGAAFNPAGLAVSLASLSQPADAAGRIVRRGAGWLFWLALAAALAPIDLLSGASGIVNFRARRDPS